MDKKILPLTAPLTFEDMDGFSGSRPNIPAWNSLFDKVMVISLPDCIERRKHIEKHLPSVGIHAFEFFDATAADDPAVVQAYDRGEVATYPPCFRCGEMDCGNPDCNNFLLPQQVATFITYMRLWQRIVKESARKILVLEDDVRIHSHVNRVLTWLTHEIPNGRVPFRPDTPCLIRLGWALSPDHSATDRCFVNETVKMSNPCHAVTREYAALLLRRYQGIFHTVDVYQHQLAPKPGEAFTIFPPIASELSWSEGAFASAIHPKAAHTHHLQSKGDATGAARNERLVHKHIKKKYFRSILVVGHPRCGTGYAANLCKQMGMDVGHEKLGTDGISSWMFAVESEQNPYALDSPARSRRALAWKYMVMAVRDLTKAAGSVMRENIYAPPSYAFRREQILRSLELDLDDFHKPLEKAVWSVTSWCRIILAQKPNLWFRIEDQHERLQDFLIQNKLCMPFAHGCTLDTSPVNMDKPYKGIRYPKPAVHPVEWNTLSAATQREISWYCKTFGYNSPVIEPQPEALETELLFSPKQPHPPFSRSGDRYATRH